MIITQNSFKIVIIEEKSAELKGYFKICEKFREILNL